MIEHTLDEVHSILYVRPRSKLEQADFEQLAATVNPHIEERGALAGLIIEVAAFPGWDSLGAMASHFRFVRDHHKHIKKVGVVSDSPQDVLVKAVNVKACAADVKQHCADVKAGEGRLEACMKSHAADLSDACKVALANSAAGDD